ncbi:hypothetical protein BD560DRAFT_447873 [Blakeslea trispora]|nr:hypothetical protein BD560DRAFT_447873 [Blakeslea trispora]
MSNPELEMADLRVPSFVPIDRDDQGDQSVQTVKKQIATKRKRGPKSEGKPSKKKALKRAEKHVIDDVDDIWFEHPKEEHDPYSKVWVGAVVDEDMGAFCIYFGQNDERSLSQVFNRESQLQDLDYAHVLGALKAAEVIEALESPFIINTTCRDLPAAIEGKGRNAYYTDLAQAISRIIRERPHELKVRHTSERKASEEQKIAIELAQKALNDAQIAAAPVEYGQVEAEPMETLEDSVEAIENSIEKLENDVDALEDAIEKSENLDALKDTIEAVKDVIDTTENNEVLNHSDEAIEDNKTVLIETKEVISTVNEPVEGILEEIVEEVKVETSIETHMEAVQADETQNDITEIEVQEEVDIEETINIEEEIVAIESSPSLPDTPAQETRSSWTSSIHSFWDTLTSPFRARKTE